MNIPRVLLGSAWVLSVAVAYCVGGSGDSGRTASGPGHGVADTTGAAERSAKAAAAAAVEPRVEDRPQEARVNVQSMIARARLELGGGMGGMMNIRGMLRAIAPIAELDDSQLQEALAEVERSVREPQQKMMFYSLLLGQWAEKDGPGAMAYAQTKLDKSSMFEAGVTGAVLSTWAKRDPEAVWKWMQTQQGDSGSDRTRTMTMSAVFAGMASNNLETALSRLNGLDEQARNGALSGIAMSASNDAARRHLLDRTSGLPTAQRDQVRQTTMQQWVMSNPEEAIAWVHALPADEQKPLRDSAGQMLLMMKPAAGADFLLDGSTEKDRPQIYERVAMQWGSQDPRAAGEWLTKQSQGPELDSARQTFARVVVQRDPAAAMDWARSVQDENQRISSISQIYQMWQSKDAPAAQAALGSLGLPPEKVQELRALKPAENNTGVGAPVAVPTQVRQR